MAEWLGWQDASGTPLAEGGSKNSVDGIISHLPGVRYAVRTTAHRIYRKAWSNLEIAPAHRTGDSFISMEKSPPRSLDFVIKLESPDSAPQWGGKYRNRRSPLSIEMGHWFYPSQRDPHTGRFTAGNPSGARRWVDGLHILGNAVDSVAKRGIR